MQNSKLFLAAAAATLSIGLAAAQEDCATALAVGVGSTAFDTATALPSAELISCVTGDANDVWFTYTAVANLGATFSLCGSSYDTAMAVYEGTCGALVELDCNDDACSLQSEIVITPVAGTTYYIRALGWNTSAGAGSLTVSEIGGPAINDECAGAIALGEGVSGPFDTSLATNSSSWNCAGTSGADLWYTYTPGLDGDFTITTCSPGTTYDTALELYSGDCGSLALIECNDDISGCAFGSFRSGITHCGIAGTTYTFRLGGFGQSTGMGEIVITNESLDACVTTLFASNNGGAVGGAVYFDATVTQDAQISVFATNTSIAAGTPITANVYTNPAGYVGNEGNVTGWTLVGSASGTSAGADSPSFLTLSAPFTLLMGTQGVAIEAIDYNNRYTNGDGINESAVSPDGVISLSLGSGSNVPFAGSAFSPRVWNGILCRDLAIGTSYCPATANSTGDAGSLTMSGSDVVADDSICLIARNLPANAFGIFLTSQTMGMSPAGQGFICLGGDIGRGVGGSIYNTGAGGIMQASTDLFLPQPMGSVSVVVGQTWNFQGWTRDTVGGMATSNTTNAISITFQ
ncbi:MAG: hypothetical protein ACJA0P_000888 [Planctomycetota bacterium]|jgi:hypothetical protein